MEKHKRYIIFTLGSSSTKFFEIIKEFDKPEEVQTFILESGYSLNRLLVVENLPLTIQIGYPYEEL